MEQIRHGLTDEQWNCVHGILESEAYFWPRPAHLGDREFLHAICWILKTGAPWRDLPKEFGSWHLVYKRFLRWSRRGIFDQIVAVLTKDADREVAMIDGSYVRAHQDSVGGKKRPGRRVRRRVAWRSHDQDSLRGRRAWQSLTRASDAWERARSWKRRGLSRRSEPPRR